MVPGRILYDNEPYVLGEGGRVEEVADGPNRHAGAWSMVKYSRPLGC